MSLWNIIKGEQPLIAGIPHALQGKGHYGEYLIDYALNSDNIPGRLRTYSNLLVPRSGGATKVSEIDVLMLHEKGIFVFESKNYSGWIFGSADQRQWTMSLNANTKERFYNPVMQNRTHVKALAKYLDLPLEAFRSYIVFSERCELKKIPADTKEFFICRRHHLVRDLKRDLSARPVMFRDDQFAALALKLNAAAERSTSEAKRQHVADAQRVASGKVCPYCGGELVQRQRKSDGHTFIGCSGYPNCKYTRSDW